MIFNIVTMRLEYHSFITLEKQGQGYVGHDITASPGTPDLMSELNEDVGVVMTNNALFYMSPDSGATGPSNDAPGIQIAKLIIKDSTPDKTFSGRLQGRSNTDYDWQQYFNIDLGTFNL